MSAAAQIISLFFEFFYGNKPYHNAKKSNLSERSDKNVQKNVQPYIDCRKKLSKPFKKMHYNRFLKNVQNASFRKRALIRC